MRTALVSFAIMIVATMPARAEIIDRVLATIGSRLILLSDVEGFRQFELLPRVEAATPDEAVVTRLIERELMLAEVNRYALPEPDPALVESRLAQIRRTRRADPINELLRRVGWSETHLRGVVRDDLRIERYLEERFTAVAAPTDEETLNYYREHTPEFAREGSVQPFEAVREAIRTRLAADRRLALIDDWVAGLRRRAEIVRLDGGLD